MASIGFKVLVVAEGRANLSTLQARICQATPNAGVLAAECTEDSLELARSHNPDIVVIDLSMQLTDGPGLCRMLKADEDLRSIPIVFQTTPHTDPERRAKALKAGAAGFMIPPFDPSETASLFYAMATREKKHAEGAFDKGADDGSTRACAGNDAGEPPQSSSASSLLSDTGVLFEALSRISPFAICVVDNNGTPVVTNRAFTEMIGYSTEDLRDSDFTQLTHPDDLKIEIPLFQEILEGTRDCYQLEKRSTRKDGETIWVRVHVTAVRGQDGHVSHAIALCEDITDRQRTNAAIAGLSRLKDDLFSLESATEKMDRITNAAVEHLKADFARIWLVRPGDLCESGCVHAAVREGPHACRDRKRCLHLVASSGRYTHIDGDHRRVPLGAYKIGRVASSEEPGFLTNDVTRDPRVHNHDWARDLGLVSFAGYKLQSSSGRPVGVLAQFSKQPLSSVEESLFVGLAGTASEVIQLDRSVAALRDEMDFTETALDAQQDTFYLFDAITGKALRWNRALREITGYSDSEIAAMPTPASFYGSEDVERAFAFIEDVFEVGYGTIELDLICKDGRTIPTEYRVSLIKDERGHPKHLISIGRDVSERRRVEAELVHHRENLEDLVEQRTSELRQTIDLIAGREVRMAGLKEVVERLRSQLEEAGIEPEADDPMRFRD